MAAFRRSFANPNLRRAQLSFGAVWAGEWAVTVLFGSRIRLFEGVDAGRVALEPVRAVPTHRVTHLTYAVRER